MLRCSSFQKLINRSLRSPWSSFPPPLSRTRSVDLFFFFFLLLLRRRFSRASSIMLLLLLLLYSSWGLCPVARALVRLFVLRALPCFCCRGGGNPDKPVFGAHSLYHYYTGRRRRRLGFLGFTVVSACIGPGRPPS